MSKYLTYIAFFCLLIFLPMKAEPCGWYGDGEGSDDESVLVDDSGSPARDENDDPAALTGKGNRYRHGYGVAKDYVKAVYWYRKAANQGFAGAQNNLAVMYEKGLGVQMNKTEAAKWFRKAAEQNNADAQHSIGLMYRDGEGVPRNIDEAAKWIGKAAEQSHHSAFRDMGEIYWEGLGVSQNNILACMWWKLGALHGDNESKKLLETAAEKMKSSHFAEAEKLAQEWMQKLE